MTGLPLPHLRNDDQFAWFVRGNWVASFYVQPMGRARNGVRRAVLGGLFIALTAPRCIACDQVHGVYWTCWIVGSASPRGVEDVHPSPPHRCWH